MASNNHTHSFANVTPVTARLLTAKPYGDKILLTFDCTGPRGNTGLVGQYRFKIEVTAAQAARLLADLASQG